MSAREFHLRTPLSDSDVERLRIGDIVYLSGTSSRPGTRPTSWPLKY